METFSHGYLSTYLWVCSVQGIHCCCHLTELLLELCDTGTPHKIMIQNLVTMIVLICPSRRHESAKRHNVQAIRRGSVRVLVQGLLKPSAWVVHHMSPRSRMPENTRYVYKVGSVMFGTKQKKSMTQCWSPLMSTPIRRT